MRKAFDANVPKLKPRLRNGATPAALAPEQGEAAPMDAAQVERPAAVEAVVEETPVAVAVAEPIEAEASARPERSAERSEARSRGAPPPAAPAPEDDVLTRRDRLDKIKRKVAEAAKPAPRIDPVPADPARAAESVLGLVRELEAELVRSREREDALRTDLDGVRTELARTAAEARGASERLGAAEREVEEKRHVLGELLAELDALEGERDGAVRRAQALSALDEERARLLEDVTRRADEEARLRAEREAEVERLSEELRAGAADGARLRGAVGELARDRDQLASELDRIRAERDDLAAAKRALEQVHAALAQARARLG
jgi:DNA repair exonuclease SbcCD ATPase subunit